MSEYNWYPRGRCWTHELGQGTRESQYWFIEVPDYIQQGFPDYIEIEHNKEYLKLYFEQKIGFPAYKEMRVYT